jgi:hypothetical protein
MHRSGEPLKRVFSIDITVCPFCGGSMRVVSDIIDPDIIQKSSITSNRNRHRLSLRLPFIPKNALESTGQSHPCPT